jgi:glutamate-1-semialdehyde 2,1-aminomutase
MRTLNYIDPIFGAPPVSLVHLPHSKTAHEAIGVVSAETIEIKKAKGAKIIDNHKNSFIDFYHTQGANILGHAPDKVLDDVNEALSSGITNGMPTPADFLLTKSIQEAMPSIEQIRLVNSGTVAVMSAIRLARAFTGKDKIIRFNGALHGSSEQFLVEPGSGLETIGIASSKGIPHDFLQHTVNLPFNNQDAVKAAFEKHKDNIAAIIVDPVLSGAGVVLPEHGFLKFLRQITQENHSLLIFDEITTGFRPKLGGAQGYFDIKPDLTVLGKIIGGGFPIGAFGGRHEIMSLFSTIDPIDAVSPLTTTAGLATLKHLKSPLFYEILNHKSRDFIYWLREITHQKGIVINAFQSMFSVYFSDKAINNEEDVKLTDINRYENFHKKLFENGIFLSPSQKQANFISIAHTPEDLNRTLEVIHQVLKAL